MATSLPSRSRWWRRCRTPPIPGRRPGRRARSRSRPAAPTPRAARPPRRGRCPRRRSSTLRPSVWRRCQASLPIVVVLPVPLTPTTSITVGCSRSEMRSAPGSPGLRQLGQQLLQAGGERLGTRQLAGLGLALQALHHARGGARPDVGEDQRLLQALPRLLVVGIAGQRGRHLVGQRLARAAQVVAQAPEEAARLGGRRRRRRWRVAVAEHEQIGPLAGHGRRPRLPTRRRPAAAPLAGQAARDDLGDAVVAHRDPVQRVGRLHRALLVGDHDELRALGVAAQQAQEAVDVEVVQRRLHLVQHVERARAGQEDREQEGQRGQRLLAARQQRQALHRLAGGRHLDLHAQAVLGVGAAVRRQRPLPRHRSRLCPPSTRAGRSSSRTRRRRPRPPGNS